MAQSATHSVTAIPLAPAATVLRQRSLWRDAARRFFKNRLAVFGLTIVLFFLFLAIFADVLAPYRYDKVYFDKVLLLPLPSGDR